MARRGEVLIAVINNQVDLVIAREQHWYRIPVAQSKKAEAARLLVAQVARVLPD